MIESAKKHVKAEQLSKVDDNNAEKAIDQEENGIDIGRGDGEKKGEDGEEEELNNETMEVRRGRAEKLLRLLGAR